jgi:glycosyltransferase involved in cell wall biosynthesis
MKEPLISVVIPTYNRENTILRAVKSVINQTYSNWELVIIDDGSKDNTKSLLEDHIQDSRITYFFQENKGVSEARNKGVSLGKGKYISFLDSDDEYIPQKLEKHLKAIQENDSDFSICNSWEFRHNKSSRGESTNKDFLIDQEFFIDSRIAHSTSFMMMKIEIAKKLPFDKELSPMEDTDLVLRYLRNRKILYCSQPLVKRYKELKSDRLSVNFDMKIEGYQNMEKKLEANTYRLNEKLTQKLKAHIFFQIGLFSLIQRDSGRARIYLAKAQNASAGFRQTVKIISLRFLSTFPWLFKIVYALAQKLWEYNILKN